MKVRLYLWLESLLYYHLGNSVLFYACLKKIFTQLPQATTVEQIEALLPFDVIPENLQVD